MSAPARESAIGAAALRYAARGWPVFPVKPDKAPRTPHGFKDATTDPEQVWDWWEQLPEAGVGIATGSGSGLWVLDVDGEDGADALHELEREYGQLPETVRAVTGGGGAHHFFRNPAARQHRNTTGRIATGLDTRGEGGYVVAPPSPHPSGRPYAWDVPPEEGELADPPGWLLQAAEGRENGGPPQALDEPIPEGQRNDRLFRLGCAVRRQGGGEGAIKAALMTTNREQCKPPLPESEIGRIAGSAARYRPEPKSAARGVGASQRDVQLVTFAGLRDEQVRWLWPERVPLGMLTLLVGDPGLGKSLLSVHLAALVSAAGRDVILLSAEDHRTATIRPRLRAAEAELGRVHTIEIRCDGIEDGIALPDDAAALDQLIAQTDARLVVVDPLNAHLPESVNSWRDQSVRRAMAPLHRVAQERDCAVLVIGHLNKASGQDPLHRTGGSIAIPAAVRSALLLARDPEDPEGERGDRRVLAHHKCNIGPLADSLACQIGSVQLDGIEQPVGRLGIIGTSEATARDLLAIPTDEERTERAEAADFLRAELAAGPKPAKELFHDAPCGERTLKSAKADLGIVSRRESIGSSGDGRWAWELPSQGGTSQGGTPDISPLAPLPNSASECGIQGGLTPKGASVQGDTEDPSSLLAKTYERREAWKAKQ